MCLLAYADSEGLDQTAHLPSLIRAFAVCKGNHWILQNVQYNLNGSNLDGSFTVDDSNSFFSPYKILPIAKENKYLGMFSYFIIELYIVCTH